MLTILPTLIAASSFLTAGDSPAELAFVKQFIAKHCVSCHGAKRPKGGIELHNFKDVQSLAAAPAFWETVANEIRERRMPPSKKTQPTSTDRDRTVAWITGRLNDVRKNRPADPGPAVARRLTRTEYNHTVRDLFGVTIRPADEFPSDGGGGEGFDNNAATLYMPPILLERCLEAAKTVSDAAKPATILLHPPANQAVGHMDGHTALHKTLVDLVPKLYRRPCRDEEIAVLERVAERTLRKQGYEPAVRLAVRAALASPKFLYRIEIDRRDQGVYRITDHELASRLSYFLWCSTPDAELYRLAGQEELHKAGELDRQVSRMLADPKAKGLSESFAGQWLGLRTLLSTHEVDRGKFPSFTPELKRAMAEEAERVVHHVFTSGSSLLDFIDADYTFANEVLAKHYGLPAISGAEFQRVPLSDHRRGGVATLASVLTLTSYAQRTSPVLRGKWVLEEMLGSPPPPPPPVVAVLSPEDKPIDGKSFRERLELHRKKSECAGCHAKMDPLGFGLENFDAIGAWRKEIGGKPVDASGKLITGERFTGPVELKKLLAERKDAVVKTIAGKLLGFAIGRGVEPHDGPVIEKMTAAVKADGYKGTTLILEIVRSLPFQHRGRPASTQPVKP